MPCSHNVIETEMRYNHARVCVCVCIRTVTAAVARAAHSISMTALLPPATGEATRRSLLRAVAVAAHAALLVIAARVHLDRERRCYVQISVYPVYERTCYVAWLPGCRILNDCRGQPDLKTMPHITSICEATCLIEMLPGAVWAMLMPVQLQVKYPLTSVMLKAH